MITAFTGHRPPKLIGGYDILIKEDGKERFHVAYEWVCEQLKTALEELKPEKTISGMALGVDQWAAEICIEMGIPFIAAVPFEGHEKKWPQASQDKYHRLLEHADEIHIICEGGPSFKKYQIRDEWMVDNSENLIAVFDGTKSGTKNTVDYAKKVGKPIYIIDATQKPTEGANTTLF